MKRLILFLVATAMVVGGSYVLLQVATSTVVMYRFVVSGVLVVTLGLYLLWDEFLR